MANKKVTLSEIKYQSGTDGKTVYASWTFSEKHLDKFEVKWYYSTLQKKKNAKGKIVKTLVWFEGSSSSQTAKKSTYNIPDNAYGVMIKVKPVSTKKDSKSYWTGDWVKKTKDVRKVIQKPEAITDISGTMTSYQNLLCIATAPDDDTTHIKFTVHRPDQGSGDLFKKAGSDVSGLCKVGQNGTARWNKKIKFPGYNYEVKAQGYNEESKLYGPESKYYPLRPDWIYTVPVKVTGVSAVITKKSGQIDRDSLTVSWRKVYGATKYQVCYTTHSSGWDNSSLYTIVETDGANNRLIIDNLAIGQKYWVRVRAVNAKAEYGELQTPYEQGAGYWSSTVTAILGKAPAAPTTYSSRLTAQIGNPVDLYWVHNSNDGSALEESVVWYKAGNQAEQTVTVKPTYDTAIDMNSPNGVYKLNTSGFTDQSKVQWKVKTKGIYPEYSEWSVTREITVYSPPTLSAILSSTANDTGESLNTITQYPFYILLNAGPSTQKAIGYYVSISPDTSFKTTNPDGTTRWVNAGEAIYSEFFDFDSEAGQVTVGNYAVINGNSMSLAITPDKMSVPIDVDGDDTAVISYTVNATVSMNSGLSASTSVQFGTDFESLEFETDGEITMDDELLCVTILPDVRETFEFEEGVEYPDDFEFPVMPRAKDMTLAVYRYEQNGEFTFVGGDIPSDDPVSVTDPHPALRKAIYRVVATSNKTGQMVWSDLDPVDLGENGIVINWDEEWQGLVTNTVEDEDGQEVIDTDVEGPWSGSRVILPANIDISNTTSPDVELAKYDGRKRPVSYYGTQLNESGTWTGQFPKSERDILEALRHLQAYMGDVYIREPSGLGYWATVTVDMPVDHLALVVTVTLKITRVEGGL